MAEFNQTKLNRIPIREKFQRHWIIHIFIKLANNSISIMIFNIFISLMHNGILHIEILFTSHAIDNRYKNFENELEAAYTPSFRQVWTRRREGAHLRGCVLTAVRRGRISHQCQFQRSESVHSTVTLKPVDIYRPGQPNLLSGLCDPHHESHTRHTHRAWSVSQITHIHLY